ncbi:DUF302 domain-containing protein [Phaeobacter gallaeciensis]|uniref:DUF302 domain-containing protein n=1 Tax=Phaeobacter gallaeciensis TaxID=60890 RepID=A0AAC9ZBF0_9RHOB|nr:DUF302 domain-containing protein [Phaeobacter gallaeciensis]AHD11023.1 hypothetical protein Gal_03303 [Phaeobacter gallaeciensis DSM 26640]ATE94286.1 hypothetical protein PhaeoP11_03290 [Phaeobacter gallaeciensis]ATE98559.1 hypothetical protein PhaeoP73_03288 [Phaeobacter gallaeciensis]ATF02950.1 hypothetical protein PhaeoP75_03339 [Phaeobacter gallaeciensis]ATF07330.1 hypothetical protein PhaeoP63_03288 [Phaeobacter gallaeciensis]
MTKSTTAGTTLRCIGQLAACLTAASTLALATSLPATAQQSDTSHMVSYQTALAFDDVTFGLENAITDRGLVVDHISHVGEMLERTRADVGSDVVLFEQAEVYSFCSASLSRKVMEANPMNITFCPYDIFVAQQPGEETTTIGFRAFPEGEMQLIQTLLNDIVLEAIEE